MRHEYDVEVGGLQRRYASVEHRGLGLPHDACSKVHEVGGSVHDNGRGRAGSVGIRERISGPQKNNLCLGVRASLGFPAHLLL